MSASIHFRPTGKEGPYLSVGAPSSFIEIVERAFGKFPVEVGVEDLKKIEGIIAASPSYSEDFENLAEAIRKHGSMEAWNSTQYIK